MRNVRVFYDVEEPAKVTILAIGTTDRNKLYLEGKEIPVKGTDREFLALSLSPDSAKIIRRARSEAKRGTVLSLKQVKDELLESSASTAAMQRTKRSAAKPRPVPSARKKR